MKRFYVLLSIALLVTACAAKQKKLQNSYFEGFVESSVTVHTGSSRMDSSLSAKYGKLVTTYIKDSFVARVYSNANNVIIAREVVRPDSLKFYQIDPASDTMWVTDLTNDYYFSNISFKRVAGKRIIGKDCIGILTINKAVPNILSEGYTSSALYYLDTSIHLCPGMNRNIKFGSYDKVFGKYPYLNMGGEQAFEGIKISIIAKRVVPGEVNRIMFEVPQNKISANPFVR